MTPNCKRCVDLVLEHEGGYSSDPRDPGNWTGGKVGVGEMRGTMHGIAASAHPDLDIAKLTLEQCEAIYETEYWGRMHGDELPLALALVTLDAEVMSGLGDSRHERAAGWLQEALGVTPDGIIGQATIAAARACGLPTVVHQACKLRLNFLMSLPTWQTFGHGWWDRVKSTEAAAMAAIGD